MRSVLPPVKNKFDHSERRIGVYWDDARKKTLRVQSSWEDVLHPGRGDAPPMAVTERPPKRPPKATTQRRVGSSQLRTAMYGDDERAHGDQAREAEAAMTKLRGGEGSITAREALSKLMAGEPAPAAADALVRRTLLSTSRSVLDTMLLEEGFVEEARSVGHLQRPGSELEHWVHGRIVASIATCRSRENALTRELGHGIDLHMLKADADAAAALKRMSELQQLRDLAREDGAAAEDLWSEFLLNEEAASSTSGGGFRYSRELLRARHMLAKPGGAARAAKLLRAVRPSRPQSWSQP